MTPLIIKKRGFNIVLIATWLSVLFIFIYANAARLYAVTGPPGGEDLRRVWAIGHLLAAGRSPYDSQLISAFSVQSGNAPITEIPVFYPFFSLSAFLPYALLSFSAARWLFLGITLAYFTFSWLTPLFRSIYRAIQSGKSLFCDVLKASVLLTFTPFLVFWWLGPTSLTPLLALIIFLPIYRANNDGGWRVLEGASLGLAIVKPSVCYLVLVYFSIIWIRNGSWRQLFGLAAAVIALAVPPVLLLPGDAISVDLGDSLASSTLWITPTVSSFLQRAFHLPPQVRTVLAAAAAAYAVWLALRTAKQKRDIQLDITKGALIPLSLMAAPYAWTYDFVVLLFSLGFLFSRQTASKGTKRLALNGSLLLVLLANIYLASLALEMALHWWYPAVIWLACLAANTPFETERQALALRILTR